MPDDEESPDYSAVNDIKILPNDMRLSPYTKWMSLVLQSLNKVSS